MLLLATLVVERVSAQTNFAVVVPDGAWTWYNDARALFHNGMLYVGYVRNGDGMSSLSAFDPGTGLGTYLWGGLPEKDDHNNPGLLAKQDGRMLALYARHGKNNFFAWRNSTTTNPVSPSDWTAEQTFIPNNTTNVTVTYSNPFQLDGEGGRIYNFLRNLNFNPNVTLSEDGGLSWSPSRLLIQKGTSAAQVDYSKSVYVKYFSNYTNRIDLLYTDGHPRHINNSLYHAYYQSGAIWHTDGAFLKSFADIPLLHDSGERGTVIYQYSDAVSADPNIHIQSGRAWCWEVASRAYGSPVCVFTVQKDNVTGTSGFVDDRIYYYYAVWTGSGWQKRFIAHAGRPLYASEDDYAGGICIDPQNPSVIYISSNSADPFNLSLSNTALRPNGRYELYRGVTSDGGLTFTWTAVTTNSQADNLRPYVPRRQGGPPSVLWLKGTYTSMHTYSLAVVGLFSAPVPQPPVVTINSPSAPVLSLTNLGNRLFLSATAVDDGLSGPAVIGWSTAAGPADAIFSEPEGTNTYAAFPTSGRYVLQFEARNLRFTNRAEVAVQAGSANLNYPTDGQVLWLKFDENSGVTAADSSGAGNVGTLSGGASWDPAGVINSAVEFNGTNGVVTVPDAPDLDNTSAFTLSYWFRADAFPPDSAGLVSKRDNRDVNNSYTTYLKASDRRIYVDIDQSNNRFASAALINTGLWYHVVLVFDGSQPSSSRARLWINGQLDVTATESSVEVPDFPSTFEVGHTASGVSTWFDGSIDDVRFYRRALNAAEIMTLAGIENLAPSVTIHSPELATNWFPTPLAGSAADDARFGLLSVTWSSVAGPGTALFGNVAVPETSVTFTNAGEYVLRLTAMNNLAEVSEDASVFVWPNTNVYQDWIRGSFPGAGPEVLGASADPDEDRVKNMVEFALGLNPSLDDAVPFTLDEPGVPIAKLGQNQGNTILLLQARRPTGRIAISYFAEVSEDLISWTQLPPGTVTPIQSGWEIVTFRDVVPVSNSAARFMRLRVAESPSP